MYYKQIELCWSLSTNKPSTSYAVNFPLPPENAPIVGARFCSRIVPTITSSPRNILALGDTGLRVKTKNDGFCKKPSDAR